MGCNSRSQKSVGLLAAVLTTLAWAGPDPVPITAEQAFDAVAAGADPVSGIRYGEGKVVIVDVRTPPEFQFQGTAGRVDHILLEGSDEPFTPDAGKARLAQDGKLLAYTVDGEPRWTPVTAIAELRTSSMAVNIPCATWNEATTMMDPVPEHFMAGIEKLADEGVLVVITMCNSGGRSTACVAKFIPDELAARFLAIYEIDASGEGFRHPQLGIHLAGLGGFQGSAYGGIYNGAAGYPGRSTDLQEPLGWAPGPPVGPSVSWRDTGLPVYIPETSCNLPDMPRTP